MTLITSVCFTRMFVGLNFKGGRKCLQTLCSRHVSATLFSDLDDQPPRLHKQTLLRFHASCLRTIWCRVRKPNHLRRRPGGEKKKKIIVAFNDSCLLLPFVWTPGWCCARTCCYGNPQVVLLPSTCFSTVSALLPASISPVSMRLALGGKWVMWAFVTKPTRFRFCVYLRLLATIRRKKEKKWETDNAERWRSKEEEAVLMQHVFKKKKKVLHTDNKTQYSHTSG